MSNLFEKSNIGKIELRNKFIRSGTWTEKATHEGDLTEELFDTYRTLAEAELGMVVVGYARVNEFERANNNMIGLYDDRFVEPLKSFTKMFHDNDTPVGIQIAMGGTQIHYDGEVDWEVMSPSDAKVIRKDENGNEYEIEVKEMTALQIKDVISDFASAARRVKEAGFDMVQLHGGHGYFLSQWMNPSLNKRTDEYGVPSKFITELYSAVRSEVGDDFPISIKINSEENIGDHSNHDAVLEMCTKLDNLGIDMIEVSGCAPSRNKVTVDNESYFKKFAGKLKQTVNCRVMLTGGNKTLSNIENVVDETGIDFVGMSRTLVSEPKLVKEWKDNPGYKARCISCNHCHRKTYVCVFDK